MILLNDGAKGRRERAPRLARARRRRYLRRCLHFCPFDGERMFSLNFLEFETLFSTLRFFSLADHKILRFFLWIERERIMVNQPFSQDLHASHILGCTVR